MAYEGWNESGGFEFWVVLQEKAFLVLRALKNLLTAKQVQTGKIIITKESPPAEVVRAALKVLQRAAHEAFDPGGNPDMTVRELLPEWWKS